MPGSRNLFLGNSEDIIPFKGIDLLIICIVSPDYSEPTTPGEQGDRERSNSTSLPADGSFRGVSLYTRQPVPEECPEEV